jgi:hypothetical protein
MWRQIGKRERLADAALAVDRDDLRLLRRLALRHFQRRLIGRFGPQAVVKVLQVGDIERHALPFQFSIIFRQAGSVKAVS